MIRSALLFASMAFAAAAQAQPAPATPTLEQFEQQLSSEKSAQELSVLAARLVDAERFDYAAVAWSRLVMLRPHVGRYRYELAAAYAAQDLKPKAYNTLLDLQKQGYAFDVGADVRFAPVSSTPAWGHIVESFKVNRTPFGEPTVAFTLPKQDLLIDSLAWDATRGALLVGSAREGSVSIVQKDGSLKPLVKANGENGLWAVFDLAVDPGRNALWVASTAVPHFKGYKPESDLGRAGVFRFDLATGKLLEKHLSPVVPGQSFFMSSIALGLAGEVYVADGVNNAVYIVKDGTFKRFFHAPVLTSIRGMAVDPARRALYFADHELGVLGIHLDEGKVFDVAVPPTLALGGIEGLQLWQGDLVAVQRGMNPARVMRLELDPAGKVVRNVRPVAANQPSMPSPTMATLHGNDLYVIGNSQKDQYDRFGLPRDAGKLEGVRIVRLDVRFGSDDAPKAPPAD